MKKSLALLACLFAASAFAQDNPFAGMKGKIKEGQWEYKMQMENMPGMPAGMTMPAMTFQHCLSAADVESGRVGQKDGKMPDGCAIKNVKVTGNTASYRMECTKDPKMIGDVDMTYAADTFTMRQKLQMNQGGQVMNVNNTMTGKYLGPCKK